MSRLVAKLDHTSWGYLFQEQAWSLPRSLPFRVQDVQGLQRTQRAGPWRVYPFILSFFIHSLLVLVQALSGHLRGGSHDALS